MALDEALLELASRFQRPVLRFYAWTQPAASFGYFQRHRDVELLTPLRPLVRRPTGGGIVPHNSDWTYSLAFPSSHEWYALAATESYRRVHQWIQAAFENLGLPTELAPLAFKPQPGQCFLGHELSDLLWRGRKIAGAAQRRRKDGLLIQGSVQAPSTALQRGDWEQSMLQNAPGVGLRGWESYQPDGLLQERAAALRDQKYSLDRYNRQR